MTQSQTVTVDQQEILNRANEVEVAPMADPLTDVPITPCELTAVKTPPNAGIVRRRLRGNTWRPVPGSAASGDPPAQRGQGVAGGVDEEAGDRADNDGAKELCRQNGRGRLSVTVRPNYRY